MRGVAILSTMGTIAVWLVPRTAFDVSLDTAALFRSAKTAIGSMVASLLVGLPLAVASATALAMTGASLAWARRGRVKERVEMNSRWPDFLAALKSRLSAGSPLPAACSAAARHIGGPFHRLDIPPGAAFAEHLDDVRTEWADPIADRVLVTLKTATRVGGTQVGDALSTLARSVADELRLHRSHHAALSQQRLTAAVALVAPWVILGISLASNPAATDAFATDTGHTILMGGAVATATGYWLSRRSARLSSSPRIFT